jgi:hypothetical protein
MRRGRPDSRPGSGRDVELNGIARAAAGPMLARIGAGESAVRRDGRTATPALERVYRAVTA